MIMHSLATFVFISTILVCVNSVAFDEDDVEGSPADVKKEAETVHDRALALLDSIARKHKELLKKSKKQGNRVKTSYLQVIEQVWKSYRNKKKPIPEEPDVSAVCADVVKDEERCEHYVAFANPTAKTTNGRYRGWKVACTAYKNTIKPKQGKVPEGRITGFGSDSAAANDADAPQAPVKPAAPSAQQSSAAKPDQRPGDGKKPDGNKKKQKPQGQ